MSRIDALKQLTLAHVQFLSEEISPDEYFRLIESPQAELRAFYGDDQAAYRECISSSMDAAIHQWSNLPLAKDGRDYGLVTGEHPVILAGAPSELVAKWGRHYDDCPFCRSAHFCATGKNLVVAMGRYLDANPYTIGAMSVKQ